MDNNLKLRIALPFFLIIIAYMIGNNVSFNPSLNPQEMEIVNFSPEDVTLPGIKKAALTINMSNPIDIHTQAPPVSQAHSDPSPAPAERKVTMIVMGDMLKRAMINGTMVAEGDTVGTLVIRKIESDRVLIKNVASPSDENATEIQQWLYLEERP